MIVGESCNSKESGSGPQEGLCTVLNRPGYLEPSGFWSLALESRLVRRSVPDEAYRE